MKMANFVKVFCLLCLQLLFIREIQGGFCTESYECYTPCYKTVKTYESCWLIFQCTKYRQEQSSCASTCDRQVCCDGYMGSRCSTPICSSPCQNRGICISPDVCSCSIGFSSPRCADIDECSSFWNECSHTCINTIGSYECSCNSGYRLMPDGYSCEDINECAEGTSNCEHTCTNTEGSFQCTCRDGYEMTSSWNWNYWGQQSCQDINECSSGTSGCEQQCTNTIGSYVCSCNDGFQLSFDRRSCEDVDECVDGTNTCEVNCENTIGSYACVCNAGFVLTAGGVGCQDIDECLEMNGYCDQGCENEPGSYHCECYQGFQEGADGKTCIDIDECELKVSGCSQNCQNTVGSFVCSCNAGFELEVDLSTCSDIDDCTGITCQHDGICLDGLNSFTCSCSAGFSSTLCETDINECLIYNGGCQEVCTNTDGSFECDCYDGHELRSDGQTCSGDNDESKNVFTRNEIGGGLLPKACFALLLPECTDDADTAMQLTSTSEWYRLTANEYYTHGITFVESASLSLPLSVRGLEVTLYQGNCRFSHSASFNKDTGEMFASEQTSEDCKSYNFSDSDIFDFISHGSFFTTYLSSLEHVLPNWLRFERSGDSVLSIQDLKSDLMYGDEIKETAWCSDAPVLNDHFYNVFKFDANFLLSVLGENISITLPVKGNKFCIITELCHISGRSFFLMIPEDARHMLEKIDVFRQLNQKYSFSILPKGIGLSVDHSLTTEVELWNGDTMFKYSPNSGLAEADVWIGGDISIDGNFWLVHGGTDVYMDVPDVNNMLTSIFLDEWTSYSKAAMSASLKLRLFGHTFYIEFGKAEIETYISIGGDQRSSCGENSNPQGIFFSVQLDLSTPFNGIPLLKDWQSSLRQKAYVLSTYSSFDLPSDVGIKNHILKFNKSANKLLDLTTTDIQQLLGSIVVQNTSLTLFNDNVKAIYKLKDFLENSPVALISVTLNEVKIFLDEVWSIFLEIKAATNLFMYDTEFIGQESFRNFKILLQNEIVIFENIIKQALANVTDTLIGIASFTGFGFKYNANLVVKTIEFGRFDLELVYSNNSLLKCSRFDKVKEHLEGEEALRVLGRATEMKKLNSFFEYERGIGVGASLSLSSEKFVFQLQVFARLLGMKATADLFVTNNGLYLYLEGNIWDIFLAQVDVSAEIGKKWYDMSFRVTGRFLAKARKKRQIQTVNSSFQDSYLDGLKKVIKFVTDAANRRIEHAQEGLTSTQYYFTKAQNWLAEKQSKVQQAHSAFDKAVATLETAKGKLEDARKPFEEALKKIKEAQKDVDNLCIIKDCPSICIPGLKASICFKKVWGVKIPYPCISLTSCMIKVPEVSCEVANIACRIIRTVAYSALEVAKIFIRVPMLVFDAAKTAVSVAQVIVDNSRVVVDVAESLMDLAQYGLELAKVVLEAAKSVLEGVKFALGAVTNVLELVIDFGLKNIIDVKNCGFDVEMSTKDLPVFAIFCDVNAFKLGWTTITIKVNFKNILQSIWNAARATIDVLIKTLGRTFGVGRKRREIAFRSLAKIHAGILRHVRDVGLNTSYLNESLDISYDILGINDNIEQDYESRVLLYKDKCQKVTVAIDFMLDSFDSLLDIVNESVQYINEVNTLKDEIQQYSTDALPENMTLEDLGINKEHAANDYNMTEDEFDKLIEDIKISLENDSLLNEISATTNLSMGNLNDVLESMESINFVETWLAAMANVTEEYFNATECLGFKDCVFYAITTLYDVYEAEEVPYLDKIRSSILDLENLVIELFQNETHSISNVSNSLDAIKSNITFLSNANPFCSLAPVFLSELKSLTVLNSTKVVLACNATGDPTPRFWWLKDDEYIPGENQMNITILSASVEDSGVYTCIAGNVVANISSSEAYLRVVTYDEDECEERSDECQHVCINVIGSYECSCHEGYSLNEDKRTCFGENTENYGKDSSVTTIAIAVSAALLGTAVISAVAFVVYIKLSKSTVKKTAVQENRLFEKRRLPHGPVVEADRTFGPGKTTFNRHTLSHKVGPM